MDFITGLPSSEDKTVVLTVIDRFSKMAHFVALPIAHFVALPKLPSAWETAEAVLVHVFRLHGLPQDVVSDRGPQFTSRFWKEFCRLLGVSVSLSSGFHPETNGQTKRYNHGPQVHHLPEPIQLVPAAPLGGVCPQLSPFKEDFNNKLLANSEELQDQKKSLNEAQTRINELETFSMKVKEALLNKLTNLEGRLRRNNIWTFGVPEGEEGNSASLFVEKLLWRELALPKGTHLLIQRAHQAAARKPRPREKPRSIIVNFLQFDTKEMILNMAWQKWIKLNNAPLFFDHNYATEKDPRRKGHQVPDALDTD